MKYVIVPGKDVPEVAAKLTRGMGGVMEGWLYKERQNMVAVLMYENNKLVGWGCYIRVLDQVLKPRNFFKFWQNDSWVEIPTNTVEISTYVHKKYRSKGYAKKILSRVLKALHVEKPGAVVRYGAPHDSDHFNKTYDREIKKHKLVPNRYFAA